MDFNICTGLLNFYYQLTLVIIIKKLNDISKFQNRNCIRLNAGLSRNVIIVISQWIYRAIALKFCQKDVAIGSNLIS